MLSALNLSRLAALAGTIGSALVIFVSSAAPNGKYTAAGVFAGIVAVWVHEEHSTERNATTAAAAITRPPTPADTVASAIPDVSKLLKDATAALGHTGVPSTNSSPLSSPVAPGTTAP